MIEIVQGDCREVLKGYPDKYFQCMMTSPPYWGLRDYGVEGQMGAEKTPEEYVENLVEVMREVKRVLRNDGVCWLNLGDSYSGYHGNKSFSPITRAATGFDRRAYSANYENSRPSGIVGSLKQKDLVGIPWRVALALQADGWYLRSDIIWAKGVSFCPTYAGSSMPESVQDRPNKAHEYVFLLSKSKQYFYDIEAVKEPAAYPKDDRKPYAPGQVDSRGDGHDRDGGAHTRQNTATRNLRSVWVINPKGFSGAHFATFPTTLVTPCLKAGTSSRGACPTCGSPWKRVMKGKAKIKPVDYEGKWEGTNSQSSGRRILANARAARAAGNSHGCPFPSSLFLGWRPTCSCYKVAPWPYGNKKIKEEWMDEAIPLLEDYEDLPTVPCKVLDPFGGAGTVGIVSVDLNLDCTLIDLSSHYCEDIALPRLKEYTDDVKINREE